MACRDYLDHLSRQAEEAATGRSDLGDTFRWEAACFALARCIDLTFHGLGASARRFLAANDRRMPHLAVALARLVSQSFAEQALGKLAADLAGSPLLVAELRAVAGLDLPANIAVARETNYNTSSPASLGQPRDPLSDFPGYVAFAKTGLEQPSAFARSTVSNFPTQRTRRSRSRSPLSSPGSRGWRSIATNSGRRRCWTSFSAK